eukprot:TRINITY_DN65647_c9_g1_i1.p1 TRINITY_DN65647_c9_g1~~TRINITY_DN65647_c9_g1_i1.p1  ORF type:complete len:263 (-),score=54.60 TRINITY_DN65647_c9_g1_i1:12-800(-)
MRPLLPLLLQLLLPLLLLLCGCVAYDEMPLDGTPVSGSVAFNKYRTYEFRWNESVWQDVEFKLTETSGSPYGFWLYIGTDYIPRDGDSDWANGCILSQPQTFVAEALFPNHTMYVSIQGIGQSEDYSVSATVMRTSKVSPVQRLKLNDMPTPGRVAGRQYAYFDVNSPGFEGNITVQVYLNDAPDRHVYVQAIQQPGLATLGHYTWQNKTSSVGQWVSVVEADYVRQPLAISLYSSSPIGFNIRLLGHPYNQTNEVVISSQD